MSLINLATLRRIYMEEAQPADLGNGGGGALDVESRIAEALSPKTPESDPSKETGDDLDDNGLPKETDVELDELAELDDEGDDTLASILGLEDDKLAYDADGKVVYNATIDGKQVQVSIGDLVKSYQLEGHVNGKSMKLEADRKEFEGMRDKAYVELATRLENANSLLQMVESSLLDEFKQIDWNALRLSDPAEWSALRQSYAERANQIQQAKSAVNQGKTEMDAGKQQEQQAKYQQFLQGEFDKMVVDNPTWSDQNVMAKEVGEIGQFLAQQYGFSPEEVANNMDARLMRMIQDARAYRSGKQAVKDKKIPDNVPKFRKPGSVVQGRDTAKAREAKALKDNIRKTGGNTDSIAAALINRM